MSKKILIIVGLVLFFVSTFISYSLFAEGGGIGNITSPISVDKTTPGDGASTLSVSPEEPRTEECPLNGELLPKSYRKIWESRRPLGVMIENHLDARPQSGLSDADVIYETVAEGGITRFLAVFYCKDAKLIGPVRSARVYYISMIAEYGDYPLYAHVGGANTPGPADALGLIRKLDWDGYNDMNQFAIPFPYYYRDYELLPGRATEHTMYSTTQKLWEYARVKRGLTNVDKQGNEWDKNFVKWKFKDDEPKQEVTKISFDFWSNKPDYAVTWTYDPQTNTYKRFHTTTPHIDHNTNKQLTTKNVVVTFMNESPANDGYPGGHRLYKTTGSGQALVFHDGLVVKGTWSKKDMFSRLKLTDVSGHEIAFDRGQIFIEMVPQGNTIDY